jgi:hypothetical protein
MPATLMAKFFEGVQDSAEKDGEWAATMDLRPSRLALGADPTALSKREHCTAEDRKLARMVAKAEESSDSDGDGSRASIGRSK